MIDKELKRVEIKSDLGLERIVAKGDVTQIKKCWHFYTSGESIDAMFYTQEDFNDGMNRIFTVINTYEVLLLSFVLMDTHVHFILYGELEASSRFVHEYIRRTSMYLNSKYKKRNALSHIQISHQIIDDDRYLKSAICYVVKNPVNAGLPYCAWDYPWSSGPLYFRHADSWTTPKWRLGTEDLIIKNEEIRKLIKSRVRIQPCIRVIDGIISPSQYVSVDIVERIFRSHKAYNYFLSTTKDVDIESRGGAISNLTVPLSEMRNNRRILMGELFGMTELRRLNTTQRLHLAKCMKTRYNCSTKQIAKLSGLIYDEVKDYL